MKHYKLISISLLHFVFKNQHSRSLLSCYKSFFDYRLIRRLSPN